MRLLDRRDRRMLMVALIIQMTTSLLDSLGVVLVGLAGVLSIALVSGKPPPHFVSDAAAMLGLGGLSPAALLAAAASVAAVLLIGKSMVAPILLTRVFRFLAGCEAVVSARLTKQLLARPLSFVQLRSTHESARALLGGTHSAIGVILGQAVVASSEVVLLAVLSVPLLLINPALALAAIAFFGAVAWVVQRSLGGRATRLGQSASNIDEVLSLRAVHEAIFAYREVTITGRRSFYVDRLQDLRERSARTAMGRQVVGILPKYVSEIALVLSAFACAGVLFATEPVTVAAGTFAVFVATATRIAPAVLRIQSAALTIRTEAGRAEATYRLADDLGYQPELSAAAGPHPSLTFDGYPDFVPGVELRNVTFAYSESDRPALCDVSLTVPAGHTLALVGRSGAGKSTLADVILGVLQPEAGDVLLGGTPPAEVSRRWPGALAYVPQQIMLIEDSVRANVTLGLPPDLVGDEQVWEALTRAQLADFVRTMSDGLDTPIGERGLRLSGGQRQRIGIARALLTRPRLLVLDEATSSLDAETEQAITAILAELENDVTLVVIAHRLSTVRHADTVVYLEDGATVATGTFAEVCDRVPDLRRQAELMGLRESDG